MPTLLQINTTLNYGSTGRIAENIGLVAKKHGWRSVMAHGPRMKNQSTLDTYQTTSPFDEKIHGAIYSLLLDRHGLGSTKATKRFIEILKSDIKPDIIHLHNIHGYYINYQILFEYLKKSDCPVVWTLHDCWSFTGHCANFDAINCVKWKTMCEDCPQLRSYPTSMLFDSSKQNFILKSKLFSSIREKLILVPVSYWLEGLVKESFLKECQTQVIHNGIDLSIFKQNPTHNKEKLILGVASPFSKEKGFYDFLRLRDLLPLDYDIMLVGLDDKQLSNLPNGILGLKRTQSQQELVDLYNRALVFINPTYQDNYPTTNLEAIACGTPVITYKTGGSPESVTNGTGIVTEQGNVNEILQAIKNISTWDSTLTANECRKHASSHFDKNQCFQSYIDLYNSLI